MSTFWSDDGDDSEYTWVPKPPKEEKDENDSKKYCFHEWIEYIGFTDIFLYCRKCNKKKEKGDF